MTTPVRVSPMHPSSWHAPCIPLHGVEESKKVISREIANMKRIENASFGLTSPLPFLSRRGTPSPLRTCCMFRAAIRPSRQRSTVRYVRSSRADLDICTGCSCQRTWVSRSGHHSFHWLIAFLVSCEVLFTIAAYDRNCDPFWHLCLHLWAGRDGDKGQR